MTGETQIEGALHAAALVRQEHRFILLFDDATPWSAMMAAVQAWVREPTLPFWMPDMMEVLHQMVAALGDSPPMQSASVSLIPDP